MKLSSETLTLLKNFASINQSIHVKPGNILRTLKVSRNVLAEATISEKFEKDLRLDSKKSILL